MREKGTMLAEAYCDPWLKLKIMREHKCRTRLVSAASAPARKVAVCPVAPKQSAFNSKNRIPQERCCHGKSSSAFSSFKTRLPEGSEVSLSELREMATRQQQQIEAQQHLLVAKEQRLKFLKQQEARHQQNAPQPAEGLRMLRDKVEGQELKLRRLRALRGQADQQRATNGNLTAELESTRALFNEKEKELSLAVAKVEELTRQLEELRSGNLNGLLAESNSAATLSAPSVVELEKLRRELLYRTKLNEQQNARILQQRETLAKRQEEVSRMDQRIAELQQRVHRKRSLNQQLASNIHAATLAKQTQLQRTNQNKGSRPRPLSTNIAAVEPLKRIPQETERCHDDMKLNGNQGDEDLSEFGLKKNDPKYQTLPYNTKFTVKSNKDSNGSGEESEKTSLIIVEKEVDSKFEKNENVTSISVRSNGNVIVQPTNQNVQPTSKIQPPHSLNNLAPRPFGSTYSSSLLGPLSNLKGQFTTSSASSSTTTTSTVSSPSSTGALTVTTNIITSSKSAGTLHSSSTPTKTTPPSTILLSPRVKVPTAVMSPVSVTTSKTSLHILPPHSPQQNDITTIHLSSPQLSPQQRQDPEVMSVSSSPESKSSSSGSSENLTPDSEKNKPALPPKPLLPVKPVPPPRQTHVVGVASGSTGRGAEVDSALMVLKGSGNKTSTTTKNGNGYRYVMKTLPPHSYASRLPIGAATMDQYTKAINHVYRAELQNQQQQQQHSTVSDPVTVPNATEMDHPHSESPSELDNFRKPLPGIGQLPIRPKPLTIKKPSGLDPPRLRASITNGNSLISKRQSDNNGNAGSVSSPPPVHLSVNRRIEMPPTFLYGDKQGVESATERPEADQDETDRASLHPQNLNLKGGSGAQPKTKEASDLLRPENGELLDNYSTTVLDREGNFDQQRIEEENNLLQEMRKKLGIYDLGDLSPEEDTEEGSEESGGSFQQLLSSGSSAVLRRTNKKGNLKTKGSSRHPRRVSFDPLALLLDASLEGELELVKKTAKEVSNPSAANDEGITALHNAICAGHLEIVNFLVEFGCDVNAKDSDGWTPLHCAASCNNLVMVKFLVEHGACIFATTLSDHETAAEKCEEDEEGFDGCSEYLYSVQEKLGILNGGAVYAVYNYEAQNPDELSFKDSDLIVVLRKGDDLEREWWWSKLRDREGYIPRNLLGLHPRVAAKTEVE